MWPIKNPIKILATQCQAEALGPFLLERPHGSDQHFGKPVCSTPEQIECAQSLRHSF